jgi:hypothetical protein
MSLSNPFKRAFPTARHGHPGACARDAAWDCDIHCADIPVNDTLLASKIPVAASATHPQRKRTGPTVVSPSSPMSRRSPRQLAGMNPRRAAYAAATAQVPHD